MRTLLLTLVAIATAITAWTQQATRETVVKQLKAGLEQQAKRQQKHGQQTRLCIACSSRLSDGEEITARNFTDNIASTISMEHDLLTIRNKIFRSGRHTETYTYSIPLSAITGARLTNCILNSNKEVDVYEHRPLFVSARSNEATIVHDRLNSSGIILSTETKKNKADVDWDSTIPIAGSWDSNVPARDKVVDAFKRLGKLNHSVAAR